MASRQLTFTQQSLDAGWQLKKPHGVGDGGTALPDPGRNLILRELELFNELLIGGSFLESTEVFSVKVLDQGLFERTFVFGRAHDGRDGLKPSPLRCPPASFASDQFVGVFTQLTNQNGLKNSHRSNRRREAD